jgi:tetratricopeptide (TPR) repeat protein
MRIILLISLFLLRGHAFIHAQSPKEIQAQMKGMVNEMNKQIAELEKQIVEAKKAKEEPEVIKDLEEQLAMLKKQAELIGGVSKIASKVPDKVVKQVIEKDTIDKLMIISVPKLDKKRIDMMPTQVLNESQLVEFIENVMAEVERIIPKQEKEEASRLYAAAKALKKSSNAINNIATNLWASGQPEQAIFLIGKECEANPNNGNNLNNFAAFLTMAGGEHAAIPILQNLERKYSGNSTISNNMGQAWYALGDMNKAKQQLRSATAAFGNHSQANQTLCWILKSEGKDKEAIEALKRSILEVYTTEKDHLLVKLGDTLKYRDFLFPYPGKPGKVEQLGIDKFLRAIPEYPFEGGLTALKSSKEWDDFRKKVIAAKGVSENESRLLAPLVEAHNKRIMADPKLLKPYNNHVHITAKAKFAALTRWFNDRIVSIQKELNAARDSVSKWREEYVQAIENIKDNCGAALQAATTFVSKSNLLNQQVNTRYLNTLKAYYNSMARLALYFTTDRSEYLAIIETAKSGILIALLNLPCVIETGCIPSSPDQQGHGRALPDFDSVNCKYKDEIYIPPFTTIKTECNIMTTEVEVGTENLFEAFELKIKLGMEENLNSGKITKGTLELGAEAGIAGQMGPITGELKGGVGAGIEVTRDGVKEVYIKTSIAAEWRGAVKEDHPDYVELPNVDEPKSATKGTPVASGELKVSWNAGPKGDWGFEHYNTSVSGSSSVSDFKNMILKTTK